MRLQKNSKEETANKKHKLITVNSKSLIWKKVGLYYRVQQGLIWSIIYQQCV
jgi:hypothetical protein